MTQTALSVKDLEEKREWWWVAEKSRSPKLDYLRKAVWKKGKKGGAYETGVKIDLERPVLFTESWKQNENEPNMMRRAIALSHVMENITIFITDQAQLVGYIGSAPHTILWYPEIASFLNEEIYNDQSVTPEPQEESLKTMAEINNYWGTRDSLGKVFRALSPDDAVKCMSTVLMWGLPVGGSFGYAGKNYEYFLSGERGFQQIYDEIQDKIDKAEEVLEGNSGPDQLPLYEKLENWESMQIILEACIKFAKRYSRLAKNLAENFESDPKRKEELLKISQTCKNIPANPPTNFQESLQYDLFTQIWSRFEDVEQSWPARPDYYNWPMYNKDVNIEKNITAEDAEELVGEFMIRASEVGNYSPKFAAEGLQGINGTWVWTLGGVNQDGSDACNDLTLAFLKVARKVRTANPTFGFRWHPKVSDEVMREVFECLRQGLGYPSIRNDPVLIANGMYWHGHPLKEMRTWVHQSCMSPCPTTKHGTQPCRMATATLNCAKMIEYALHNGYDHCINMQLGPETGDASKFETFEEFYAAWVAQMEWLMNFGTRVVNLGRKMSPTNFGRPYLSSITERAVENGIDALSSEGERGNCWVTFFTWTENVDSLAAIKKLVFDDKKYSMAELVSALKNDWNGKEEMRLDFANAPKWGNDDDYVDDLMIRCLRDVARHSWAIKCPSGNPWPALPENVSGNIHFSGMVHALPNGRKLNDALYDGGISPGPGLDKNGPTAVLKSCSKIDHVTDGRAFLLNQRLSPNQLSGEKGYQLWRSYMRTWSDLGLDHVQFNMVDDATLHSAQRDPEKYQEVIVRVAGYSAHFVDISRKTQDNIIQRTIQGI